MFSMCEFTPNSYFQLILEIPLINHNYRRFLDGDLTWDKMLLDTYDNLKERCDKYDHIYPGIKHHPAFTAPLSTTDQSILISCIIGCLRILDSEARKQVEQREFN